MSSGPDGPAHAGQGHHCLIYLTQGSALSLPRRGLTVWSGLPPAQTRLAWQLCWALGAHGQAQALPCQVTMHRVHPAVPGPVSESVDTSGGEEAEAEASAVALPRGGGGGAGGAAVRSARC